MSSTQRRRSTTPDCSTLEDRVLLSATPLTLAGGGTGEQANDGFLDLIAPMSGGAANDPHPEVAPIPVLVLSEDPNNYTEDLNTYFQDLNGNGDAGLLTFSLVSNSNPELIDDVSFDDGVIEIDVAGDASGDATLRIRATDSSQQWVEADWEINVKPVNDRPTTSGFTDVVVTEGESQTVIDLFAAFDDVEDADELLTFEVVSLSNPELFDSVQIDGQLGTLTLDYAEGALGSSQIVLRATDSEGLSVEITTADADFDVWGYFHPSSRDRPQFAGIEHSSLLTGWAFFDYDPQTGYDVSEFNPARLRYALDVTFPIGYDSPIVLDVEAPNFGNTPEGRDNLAEILNVAHEHRPDLNFGFYMLMPEFSWWIPVLYQRGLDEIAAGVNGWYAGNMDTFQLGYDNWMAHNELYRTEAVASALGGGTVADRIDYVFPRLYTDYRNGPADLWADVDVQSWDAYAEHTIAEARKYNVPVAPFISPSVSARSQRFLEKDFFRQQLDLMFEMADGVTIFEPGSHAPYEPGNQGWLEAVEEFMLYVSTPTEFTISVQPSTAPTPTWTPPVLVDPSSLSDQFDLWSAFADPDHSDDALSYSIASSAGDFVDLHIDDATDTLYFELASGFNQTPEIVIQAVDPDGGVAQNTLRLALPNLLAPTSYMAFGFEVLEDHTLSLPQASLPEMSTLLTAATGASHFAVDSSGGLEYVPHDDWFGSDFFRYASTNGTESTTIDVHISVAAVNDAPRSILQSTYETSLSESTLDIDLRTLFEDVDNSLKSLEYYVVEHSGAIFDGAVVISEDDVATLSFSPDTVGSGSLGIQAVDPDGLSSLNTVEIVRNSTGSNVSKSGPTAPSEVNPENVDLTHKLAEQVGVGNLAKHLGMIESMDRKVGQDVGEDEEDPLMEVPLSLATSSPTGGI